MKLSNFTEFECAGWQWLEAGRFLLARLTLKDRVAPEAFLGLPQDWAFFWKTKETSSWLAAWGLTEKMSFDDLLQSPVDPLVTVCGGFPFAASHTRDSEWHEFSNGHWFVPKFIWRQDGDAAVLELLCLLRDARNDDNWKSESLHGAWKFYQALQKISASSVAHPPKYLRREDCPSPQRWRSLLDDASRHMQTGEFGKVVLSRRVRLDFAEPVAARDVFRKLWELHEESFIFACQSAEGRCFMGRSPERLLAWQGEKFLLDAIAGTRRRNTLRRSDQAFSYDMQQSPKEQNEHDIVTGAIKDLLEDEGVSFEALDQRAIIRLQHVQHMRTRFKGEMPRGRRSIELVPLLHPTPAVGGFPRQKALQFLLAKEGFERGWFAGGIGVVQGQEGEVAIGIRSALVDGRQLWVYAGAGIVPGSDAEAEWQETEAKMQNFLGFLQAEDWE